MADEPPADFSFAEALTPFAAEEVASLRHYDELAEELKRAAYFRDAPMRFELRTSSAGDISSEFDFGDEEAVTTMLVRLRNLWDEFDRAILPLLRTHAEGLSNDSAEWFRAQLERKQQRLQEIRRTALVGLEKEWEEAHGKVVSEARSPEDNFFDWLYGAYLHKNKERLRRLAEWSGFGDITKANFLTTAGDLAREYYAFVGIVREVLAEPALVG